MQLGSGRAPSLYLPPVPLTLRKQEPGPLADGGTGRGTRPGLERSFQHLLPVCVLQTLASSSSCTWTLAPKVNFLLIPKTPATFASFPWAHRALCIPGTLSEDKQTEETEGLPLGSHLSDSTPCLGGARRARAGSKSSEDILPIIQNPSPPPCCLTTASWWPWALCLGLPHSLLEGKEGGSLTAHE